MNSSDYIEVGIRLEPYSDGVAEMIVAELSELPYDSFVTEPPLLKCYIQRPEYSLRDLKVVLSGFPEVAEFNPSLVPESNWNRQWEESFQPIVVDGGKVTVKASFNENAPRSRFNIWIDPSMAFGTGSHQTTYMMIQSMLRIEDRIRGRNVLDMGCGTGVLAVLAAKMRARKVWAIDIDAVAARSSWGNVHWNRVASRVETLCGDASLLQMGLYDVILANIHRNIIVQDMPTYIRSLRRGGTLLVSGFFDEDMPLIEKAALEGGLSGGETLSREGWACMEFQKKA
mgnify:FL=1